MFEPSFSILKVKFFSYVPNVECGNVQVAKWKRMKPLDKRSYERYGKKLA